MQIYPSSVLLFLPVVFISLTAVASVVGSHAPTSVDFSQLGLRPTDIFLKRTTGTDLAKMSVEGLKERYMMKMGRYQGLCILADAIRDSMARLGSTSEHYRLVEVLHLAQETLRDAKAIEEEMLRTRLDLALPTFPRGLPSGSEHMA
ncbi:hypothetical protein CF335_g4576 [Tilletia laevis]|nr:hypothetical protein CF335_g4576 [Tilletia laevis]